MAITNYTTLLSGVASYLARADLTALIPDFVRMCESDLNNALRVKEMESSFSGTMASGVLAVPTRYLALAYAYLDKATPIYLATKAASWIQQEYPVNNPGEPRFIGRTAGNFLFGPYPDADYDVAGYYYKSLDLATDTTNEVLTRYVNLYLYGTLCHAAFYTRDVKAQASWLNLFSQGIDLAKKSETGNRFSGGPIASARN